MTGILADTNLLVYAYDPADEGKRACAQDLLTALVESNRGCLSAQTLSEFVSTVLRPRNPLLTIVQAEDRVAAYVSQWRVFHVTPAVVREALRGVREFQLNFWDAQIWAVARLHGIETVLSEDFQNGMQLEGVRFLNPFVAGFDLDVLM